ncbi:MAG: hypothetical protein ABJF11_12960 [Reichenbachiella sp.]|uniref:hypothetical protein n=1 Tax=Reichenbachiella sp. TaxID=2184521 RepID=UPI0032657E7B
MDKSNYRLIQSFSEIVLLAIFLQMVALANKVFELVIRYLSVKYFIPLGTEFYPYVSAKQLTGAKKQTTVEINFDEEEIVDTLHIENPESGEYAIFYQLPLEDNKSVFDSYIVSVASVIES